MSVVGIVIVFVAWFVCGLAVGLVFGRAARHRDDVTRYRMQGQKAALDAIDDLRTRNQARREDESR